MALVGWLPCLLFDKWAKNDENSLWAGLPQPPCRGTGLAGVIPATFSVRQCGTEVMYDPPLSSHSLALSKGVSTHLHSGKIFPLLCCINTKANNQTSKQDTACLTFNPSWKQRCPDSSTGTEPCMSTEIWASQRTGWTDGLAADKKDDSLSVTHTIWEPHSLSSQP